MRRNISTALLAFFVDVFLILFFGILTSAAISFSATLVGIEKDIFKPIFSVTTAVLGVSVFSRGTLSTLEGKLPEFTVHLLVVMISTMFILGYWPVAGLLTGFLGGFAEHQVNQNNRTSDNELEPTQF